MDSDKLSRCIRIHNLPSYYNPEEIIKLLSDAGSIEEYKKGSDELIIIYTTSDAKETALFFDDYDTGTYRLKIDGEPTSIELTDAKTDKPNEETDKPNEETDKSNEEIDKPNEEIDKPNEELVKPKFNNFDDIPMTASSWDYHPFSPVSVGKDDSGTYKKKKEFDLDSSNLIISQVIGESTGPGHQNSLFENNNNNNNNNTDNKHTDYTKHLTNPEIREEEEEAVLSNSSNRIPTEDQSSKKSNNKMAEIIEESEPNNERYENKLETSTNNPISVNEPVIQKASLKPEQISEINKDQANHIHYNNDNTSIKPLQFEKDKSVTSNVLIPDRVQDAVSQEPKVVAYPTTNEKKQNEEIIIAKNVKAHHQSEKAKSSSSSAKRNPVNTSKEKELSKDDAFYLVMNTEFALLFSFIWGLIWLFASKLALELKQRSKLQ